MALRPLGCPTGLVRIGIRTDHGVHPGVLGTFGALATEDVHVRKKAMEGSQQGACRHVHFHNSKLWVLYGLWKFTFIKLLLDLDIYNNLVR